MLNHSSMIIDGLGIAKEIREEIKHQVSAIKGRAPCLAVILIGENPASQLYVKRKAQACIQAGMLSIKKEFPESISELEVIEEIKSLNNDRSVDGILIQLPLPKHVNPLKVMDAIDPSKDVDGFHAINVGKLHMGDQTGFIPCTPLGISVLMEKLHIETEGKKALVIGRSNIVGRPMAALLSNNWKGGNATVTLAHRYSQEIDFFTKKADIIIAALGKPRFITAEMIKEGVAIFDVGINRLSGGTLSGDVDFENVKDKCSYITPVPGGIGPMTIAMLLKNTLKSFSLR